MTKHELGNGDPCPYPVDQQTTTHGKMYVLGSGVQWCAHSDHSRSDKQKEHAMVFVPKDGSSSLDGEKTATKKPVRAAKADKPKAEKPARVAKAPAEPKPCTCGCGGTTKGGRFIPGHDARFHGRIKRLVAIGMSHDDAEKIAADVAEVDKRLKAVAKSE